MKRVLSAAMALLLLLMLAGCPALPGDTQATTGTDPVPTVTDPADPTQATDPVDPTDPTQPEEPTEPLPTDPPAPTEPPEPIDPPPYIQDTSFVRVKDYIPDIIVELRYATTNNFTGVKIYNFDDAYLRYGTVKKLAVVQERLKEQGLGLKIWDAFRPVSAQQSLWNAYPDPIYVADPANGYSAHSRGNTLDITLVDENGNELEMPSEYDDFTGLADRDYSECTFDAAQNAYMLELLMMECGFKGYVNEWWHYTDTSGYPVDKCLDPAVVSVWYPNCNEYIGMLAAPDYDAALLARINRGEPITLLGWDRFFAYVDYKGRQGYVVAAFIMPGDTMNPEHLSIVQVTDTYTYEQLVADVAALEAQYPTLITVGTVGTSELGRDIPVIVLGDPNAKHQVLLQGAIHAREHMTAWLLMSMAEFWAGEGLVGCEDTCFHIIPMMNPDGVHLAQTGELTDLQLSIYKRDKAKGRTEASLSAYASVWKANGLGVDLNHSFDAGWETTFCVGEPSSMNYNGKAPFEAAEARALRDYTLAHDLDVTISYHSHGSVIYYEYGKKVDVNKASESLAIAAEAVTGYVMMDSSSVGAAGYKDWCMEKLEIPSLTLEIGYYPAPSKFRETYNTYARNLNILPAIVCWLNCREAAK